MRSSRVAVTLVLAFLFGGALAETFLKARDAVERKRAVADEGAAGELVALELQDGSGQTIARPRVVVAPGRAVELTLRSPESPDEVRVSLRLETERLPSGDLLVGYHVFLPRHAAEAIGQISVTPGVEQAIDFGELPVVATIFTIPVPSAAFDAYLDFERTRGAFPRI